MDPTVNPNTIMAADPSFKSIYRSLKTVMLAYKATLITFSPFFSLISLKSVETSLIFSIF
jgi:hypothetical protein